MTIKIDLYSNGIEVPPEALFCHELLKCLLGLDGKAEVLIGTSKVLHASSRRETSREVDLLLAVQTRYGIHVSVIEHKSRWGRWHLVNDRIVAEDRGTAATKTIDLKDVQQRRSRLAAELCKVMPNDRESTLYKQVQGWCVLSNTELKREAVAGNTRGHWCVALQNEFFTALRNLVVEGKSETDLADGHLLAFNRLEGEHAVVWRAVTTWMGKLYGCPQSIARVPTADSLYSDALRTVLASHESLARRFPPARYGLEQIEPLLLPVSAGAGLRQAIQLAVGEDRDLCLWISGASGNGKTTLAGELCRHCVELFGSDAVPVYIDAGDTQNDGSPEGFRRALEHPNDSDELGRFIARGAITPVWIIDNASNLAEFDECARALTRFSHGVRMDSTVAGAGRRYAGDRDVSIDDKRPVHWIFLGREAPAPDSPFVRGLGRAVQEFRIQPPEPEEIAGIIGDSDLLPLARHFRSRRDADWLARARGTDHADQRHWTSFFRLWWSMWKLRVKQLVRDPAVEEVAAHRLALELGKQAATDVCAELGSRVATLDEQARLEQIDSNGRRHSLAGDQALLEQRKDGWYLRYPWNVMLAAYAEAWSASAKEAGKVEELVEELLGSEVTEQSLLRFQAVVELAWADDGGLVRQRLRKSMRTRAHTYANLPGFLEDWEKRFERNEFWLDLRFTKALRGLVAELGGALWNFNLQGNEFEVVGLLSRFYPQRRALRQHLPPTLPAEAEPTARPHLFACSSIEIAERMLIQDPDRDGVDEAEFHGPTILLQRLEAGSAPESESARLAMLDALRRSKTQHLEDVEQGAGVVRKIVAAGLLAAPIAALGLLGDHEWPPADSLEPGQRVHLQLTRFWAVLMRQTRDPAGLDIEWDRLVLETGGDARVALLLARAVWGAAEMHAQWNAPLKQRLMHAAAAAAGTPLLSCDLDILHSGKPALLAVETLSVEQDFRAWELEGVLMLKARYGQGFDEDAGQLSSLVALSFCTALREALRQREPSARERMEELWRTVRELDLPNQRLMRGALDRIKLETGVAPRRVVGEVQR